MKREAEIFALLGRLVKSPEAANSVGFIAVFPITFISSAFVPTDSMPDALEAFAEVNPFTIVVFAPLAVARYRRAAGRT